MRFRIRTLILIVFAFAILIAIAEVSTRDERNKRRIEADLIAMGAYYVSFDSTGHPDWVSFIEPNNLERIDRYKSINDIDLCGAHLTDETVRQLAKLEHIEILHATECNLTDTQLESLAKIGSMWCLRLNGTAVTDSAIPAIASIRGLESLDISGTLITPAGAAELQRQRPKLVVRHEAR